MKMILKSRVSNLIRGFSAVGWSQRSSFHVQKTLLNTDKDPPELVLPMRRRSKISPEDRMKSMLEQLKPNIDHDKAMENDTKSDILSENDTKSDILSSDSNIDSNKGINNPSTIKKTLPWRFGRRRSLSPMTRVQGMIEEEEDKKK